LHEEDEVDNESSETLELTELIDSDVELRHWIGPGGRAEAIAASVDAGELCYTKPSVELEPFESEHEGCMGNWGNTVDRWYHRAAVVLWPRERTFVIRAKASARWAIGAVTRALKAGHTGQALALAQRLLPFWAQAVRREEKRGFFDATVKIAAKLDDPNVAAALLQPFTLTRLTSNAAPRLVDCLDRYGLEWCRTLFRQWASKSAHESPEARLSWMGSTLTNLRRPLCAKDSPDGQVRMAARPGATCARSWRRGFTRLARDPHDPAYRSAIYAGPGEDRCRVQARCSRAPALAERAAMADEDGRGSLESEILGVTGSAPSRMSTRVSTSAMPLSGALEGASACR
jgi:hypothetical protein